MASTNKTPNYDLPQFIATDKPTWLGDVNDAMSKIDAGMEANKSSGESTVGRVTALEATVSEHTDQIGTVTETANTAGATATAAQNAASAASALATTANSNANAITNSLTFNPANVVAKSATDHSVTVSPTGDIAINGGNLRCICSNDGSWLKIYGYLGGTIMHTNSSIATTIKFPGMVKFPPSEKYNVNSLGISVIDPVSGGNTNTIINTVSVDVNTDGSVDLIIWATIQVRTGIFINIFPCMINNKSYGDVPQNAAVYNAIMGAMS